ncbi:MAG: bifunctional folylpolyglutamate synthase/dihydrofolate synthase, partial [Deltaproteobacteria bacterium]|nr:bifunctional folylpolyglutamate synthase/dihydrofolate synthase [Deltaproteobacteria bacterium]
MTPYEHLLARLLPARRFGIVLGLERMNAIFERLGHPERRLGRVILVGGTNGKGSTVAMIAQLLQLDAAHANRIGRVAMYTSPHLSCLRERITFLSHRAGEHGMIDEESIVAAADRVSAAGGDELTFFEQLTAIACVAIAERGVDFTVLEVGLGGRLDATNAIPAEVAVVTGVAMDHAAILGDTLAKIALEKAGIFKPEQKVVIGASGDPEAVPVLVEAARKLGAKITVVDDAAIADIEAVATSHLGAYQQRNVATAFAAVAKLDRWVLRQSVMDLQPPPGRFELVEREGDEVDFILDG